MAIAVLYMGIYPKPFTDVMRVGRDPAATRCRLETVRQDNDAIPNRFTPWRHRKSSCWFSAWLSLLVDAVSNHPERKPTFLLTMLALGVLTVVSALMNGVTEFDLQWPVRHRQASHLLKIASYIAVAVTLVGASARLRTT